MIRAIVAIDQKHGVAKKGFQPWYIPDDEAYFSAMTKTRGANILVGSTTYKTFDEPLAGRTNYVATRRTEPISGAHVVHDVPQFLESFTDDLWVIGGAKIFDSALRSGLVDELYITHIDADFGCDQYFPEFDELYTLSEKGDDQSQNGFAFRYCVYTRR